MNKEIIAFILLLVVVEMKCRVFRQGKGLYDHFGFPVFNPHAYDSSNFSPIDKDPEYFNDDYGEGPGLYPTNDNVFFNKFKSYEEYDYDRKFDHPHHHHDHHGYHYQGHDNGSPFPFLFPRKSTTKSILKETPLTTTTTTTEAVPIVDKIRPSISTSSTTTTTTELPLIDIRIGFEEDDLNENVKSSTAQKKEA